MRYYKRAQSVSTSHAILLVPFGMLSSDTFAEFAKLINFMILILLSFTRVAADLHEGSFVGDELVSDHHHELQVVTHPVVHIALQILEGD